MPAPPQGSNNVEQQPNSSGGHNNNQEIYDQGVYRRTHVDHGRKP